MQAIKLKAVTGYHKDFRIILMYLFTGKTMLKQKNYHQTDESINGQNDVKATKLIIRLHNSSA